MPSGFGRRAIEDKTSILMLLMEIAYGMFSTIWTARMTLVQLPTADMVAVTTPCEDALSVPEESDDIDNVTPVAVPIASTALIKRTALSTETRNEGNRALLDAVLLYIIFMFSLQ